MRKKLIVMFFITSLILSLASCGSGEKTPAQEEQTTQTQDQNPTDQNQNPPDQNLPDQDLQDQDLPDSLADFPEDPFAPSSPSADAGGTDTAQPPQADIDPFTLYEPHEETVTMMLYLTGSDLESSAAAATKDLEEIAKSGIDLDRVNMLVFTGGAPVWHSTDPPIPTDANVLYLLTEDGYQEVTRFEPLSMGDPENLERFLTYCGTNFESDSYDLIMWDHGNGPVIGYGSDKQYGGDSLTLAEMRQALEKSPFGEDNKLALIGFDACLMSSVELMCVTAPFAQYLVASQETEPHFGWDYDFLALCGRISQEDLAREIVREYSAFCSEYFAGNSFLQSDVTLAAVDLSYAGDLEKAINTLFKKAARDVSGDYNKLAISRIRSHGFGRASTGSEYDLVDLESLMQQMESRYRNEAQAVRDISAKAVLVSDATVPESCGLSLFYPYFNKNYYRKAWKSAYAQLGILSDYRNYLSRYEQVWLGTDQMELFGETLAPKAGSGNTFSMQLTPEQLEQYASSCFYILRREGQEVYTPVFESTDIKEKKGVLTARFDGNIIYYSDNYDKKGIPVTRMWDTLDGVTNYTLYSTAIRDEDGKQVYRQCEIQVSVNQKNGELTVKGIYPSDDGNELSTGKKEPIDPADWTQFRFVSIKQRYLTRDKDGRILPFREWPEGDWIVWNGLPVANGLNFTYEQLYDDGGDYFIMFEVTDVQGNRYASELLPITLAEAPADEYAIQTQEVIWDEGDSVSLYEENGIQVLLEARTSRGDGHRIWQVRAVNQNPYPVKVLMKNFYINGYIYAGEETLTVNAPANGEGTLELKEVEAACRMALIDRPDNLYFGIRVVRADTWEYILYYKGSTIFMGEGITPESAWRATLGAKAEPQLLLEEDGIKAELLGMGSYTNNFNASDLTTRIKIANTSYKTKEVSIAGIALDGVYFHEDKSCTLQPGEVWYTGLREYTSGLTILESAYSKYEREQQLFAIGKADLLIVVDKKPYWCSVELSERGEQEDIGPEGELIYEDDDFALYLSSFRKEKGASDSKPAYLWEFWAVNKCDRMRTITLKEQNGGSSSIFLYTFGPQTKASVPGILEKEIEGGSVDVTLQFRDYYNYGSSTSVSFALPAAEQ